MKKAHKVAPVSDVLAGLANRKLASYAQIFLAWMLHKYPNAVPIPGSKNQERILENLGAWNVKLTDMEFAELEAALDACTVYGYRGYVESEQLWESLEDIARFQIIV